MWKGQALIKQKIFIFLNELPLLNKVHCVTAAVIILYTWLIRVTLFSPLYNEQSSGFFSHLITEACFAHNKISLSDMLEIYIPVFFLFLHFTYKLISVGTISFFS